MECDTCYQKIEDVDLEVERKVLQHRLGRTATDDELTLYLQHPNDAVDFFKFEATYGKTWVLSPRIWFRKGGFSLGEKFDIPDAEGKLHSVEIGPQRKTKSLHSAVFTRFTRRRRKRPGPRGDIDRPGSRAAWPPRAQPTGRDD